MTEALTTTESLRKDLRDIEQMRKDIRGVAVLDWSPWEAFLDRALLLDRLGERTARYA